MANQFNYDNFNSFLSQAADTIACGTECQQQRTAEQLKQTYLNSQTNLDSASNQVQVAQKNYVTFTQGQQAYSAITKEQLTSSAQGETMKFLDSFNNDAKKIYSDIQSYSGLYVNLQNVFDLYDSYVNKNNELYTLLKDETSDTLTNERKTYYEDQGIDNLKFWYYYILLTIYIVFAVCFAALSFIYPSNYNWKYKLAICILFAILPFISTYLLGLLLTFLNYIYNLMPKNVHLTTETPRRNVT